MSTQNIFKIALVTLIGLFCFSLFKNIQYPLLWEDEADTAMFGKRILQFGYPKVHDGKNIINSFSSKNTKLAVDEKTDAYLYQGWTSLYFAAMVEKIASSFSDIYTKTAILRIPFAIVGLIGIMIFATSVSKLFPSGKNQKTIFYTLFIFLELTSVSLVLHLREVRYYSLIIFLSSCTFYIYFSYRNFGALRYRYYFFFIILLLFFIFNTFHPVFFIFAATSVLYESGLLIFDKLKFRLSNLYPLLPVIIASILIFPLIFYFRILETTADTKELFGFSFDVFRTNIMQILEYLDSAEYLELTFILLIVFLFLPIRNTLVGIDKNINNKLRIMIFFMIFFVIYILLIAQNPIFIFTRYFIILQPIITIILVIELFVLYDFFKQKYHNLPPKKYNLIYLFSAAILLVIFGRNKIDPIKGHIYEMFHQYKGPLDYIIPYIKQNSKNPENLVIATNYEETSYMYYLGSQVTVGYVGNNLGEDSTIQPDIISTRRRFEFVKMDIFTKFLEKDKYQMVEFRVFDYYVNNIPDLQGKKFMHQFKTKVLERPEDRSFIFVKVGTSSASL